MIDLSIVSQSVKNALLEDVGNGDITALLISSSQQITARIITRESAVICGIPWVNEVYRQLDETISIDWHVKEGECIASNQMLCEIKGFARSLLTGERTGLNFLQTLSGTATLTRRWVEKLKGTSTQLLDTRKTIPGLRIAQKYAVRCGGGHNHRMGLYDAYLIKENHILACGSITKAVQIAQALNPNKTIEVEVENLTQLREALTVNAPLILLDNFNLNAIEKAVKMNQGKAKLEVSGGVSENNIRSIAELGVDYISVGSLTKHINAIDLSMLVHSNS